jgi:hypothetical protein
MEALEQLIESLLQSNSVAHPDGGGCVEETDFRNVAQQIARELQGIAPTPATDIIHFLDYVGLNYTPVRFKDGVCWDLDDSEAPVSSEEVIADYKEHMGE